MHNLGFSLVRPKYSRAKARRMNRSVKALKKLNELAADEKAVVVYQGEFHFQVTVSVTRK